MSPTKTQINAIIRSGLYGDNLRLLLLLVNQLFHQRPALYGTLICIFRSLEDEYDDAQGTTTERYNQIVSTLTQPLLDALEAEFAPSSELMERLNRLHSAFFALG